MVSDDVVEPPHLLVVDDDHGIRRLLGRYLGDNGYRVTTAADVAEARQYLGSYAFDLIILDVMMPGESGLDFTLALRRTSRVPILLLTAMGEVDDRITGLERGADDYLVKPFEPRELLLRIRNILQRVPSEAAESVGGPLRFGPCVFDPDRGELTRAGEPVHLTQAEASLLKTLARQPGQPISREDLSEQGQFSGNVRTVDVQMTRLRRKIERDPRYPRYLQTVRGTGYMLQPD